MDVFLLLFFLTTTTTTTTKRLGRSEVNKESIRADAVDFGEIHAIQSNHQKCIRLPTTATHTHTHPQTHTPTHSHTHNSRRATGLFRDKRPTVASISSSRWRHRSAFVTKVELSFTSRGKKKTTTKKNNEKRTKNPTKRIQFGSVSGRLGSTNGKSSMKNNEKDVLLGFTGFYWVLLGFSGF